MKITSTTTGNIAATKLINKITRNSNKNNNNQE